MLSGSCATNRYGGLTGDDLSELLECAVSGGVSRNVEVSDPARSDFQDHEDVEHSKCGSDRDEEVAGQNALGMVADERHPTLRRGPTLERVSSGM